MSKMQITLKQKSLLITTFILITSSALTGCIQEQHLSTSLTLIEPKPSDFDIELEIVNYTHEYNYVEKEKTNPIYNIKIPEYLFIRFTGLRKSINFFALKLDSIQETKEIYETYKETYLLHATELQSNITFGDQTFLCQTMFGGVTGYGLEFRYANVLIVLVGMTVEQEVFEHIGQIIEQRIKNHIE